MAATIIDGKAYAEKITADLKAEIEAFKQTGGAVHLVAVQVGENAASRIYIRNQKASCEAAAIDYTLLELPAETSQADLEAKIRDLNADSNVTGLILQMPLPAGLDPRAAQGVIAPAKDVEGILPQNLGLLVAARPGPAPCTALGAFELICSLPLEPKKAIEDWVEADIKRRGLVRGLYGHNAVVVGHSEIVGKPLSLMLLNNYCTVTTCHVGTVDLAAHTRRADILCSAVGVKPDLITADMVKPGAVVIDIAMIRVKVVDASGEPVYRTDPDGSVRVSKKTGKPIQASKTVGDVDFEAAKEMAGFITPVPGGVGPMTVAMLLRNTLNAAKAAVR